MKHLLVRLYIDCCLETSETFNHHVHSAHKNPAPILGRFVTHLSRESTHLWDKLHSRQMSLRLAEGVLLQVSKTIGLRDKRSGTAADCACNDVDMRSLLPGDLFVPFMFLVCNGSDLIGRLVAGAGAWSSKPPSSLTLLTYTLLRIPLSIPLLFCNMVTPKPWRLPLVFR